MADAIAANLLSVMSPAELAQTRKLVQFHNAPWPVGPVILAEEPLQCSTPTIAGATTPPLPKSSGRQP